MIDDIFGFILSDTLGGFIVWAFKGFKKGNLKKEMMHAGWRNSFVSFMTIVVIIVIILLIIALLV